MNRSEFVKMYKDFIKVSGLKPEDCPVTAGGVMLMHGLRDETGDIDASTTTEKFNEVARKLKLKPFLIGSCNVVNWKNVDLHDDNVAAAQAVDLIDGVMCASLEDVIEIKRKMSRPKDLLDIEKIEAYLATRHK